MFWSFIILAAIGTALTRLGELSVWVAVLSFLLKTLLILGAVIGLWLLYLKDELTAEKKRCRLIGHKTAEAIRYNERSTVERVNARVKDEFGGRVVRVRGQAKVMCHLMFGMLALTANQMMILIT